MAYQDSSADIDDLLSGLEAAEGESDWSDSVSKEALFGLEESESKEALDAEANAGIIKAAQKVNIKIIICILRKLVIFPTLILVNLI